MHRYATVANYYSMADRTTAAAACLFAASVKWLRSPPLAVLVASGGTSGGTSGGSGDASGAAAATAAAVAAAAASGGPSWTSGEVAAGHAALASMAVPRCSELVDLARRKHDIAYPWAGAEGSAVHVGIVALHGALEVVADFGPQLRRPAWEGLAAALVGCLDVGALPVKLVMLDDLSDHATGALLPPSE